MTETRWKRVESLFHQALALQGEEREKLLAGACQGDQALYQEILSLLSNYRSQDPFAIALSGSSTDPEAPSNQLIEAAEAVQHASRRILEGLSPLYLEELGLEKSIETLLQNAHSALPSVTPSADIDPRLDDLDHLMSQTIYRVIQEAVTNVCRESLGQETRLAGSDTPRRASATGSSAPGLTLSSI